MIRMNYMTFESSSQKARSTPVSHLLEPIVHWGMGIALLATLAMPVGAVAAPVNNVYHQSLPGGPNVHVGPQNTPIDYDYPYQVSYFAGHNYGEVYADTQPGSVGIYALAYNDTTYAPQGQGVTAGQSFDVIFSSPGSDPINVAMNMTLSGMIMPGTDVTSGLKIIAGSFAGASGSYAETISSATSMVEVTRGGILAAFDADGTDQTISTPVMTVPVNTPVTMNLGLQTEQTFHYQSPTISFGNTLTLTEAGDVFTILGPNAGDIIVNSVDAGIVNNRFGQGIPEPGTLVLASLCLFGVLNIRRVKPWRHP